MYGHSQSENNNIYCISKKTYLDDYSNTNSRKIDMTLSGTYLGKYPFKFIKKYKLDEYPKSKDNAKLITSIKNKFK